MKTEFKLDSHLADLTGATIAIIGILVAVLGVILIALGTDLADRPEYYFESGGEGTFSTKPTGIHFIQKPIRTGPIEWDATKGEWIPHEPPQQ